MSRDPYEPGPAPVAVGGHSRVDSLVILSHRDPENAIVAVLRRLAGDDGFGAVDADEAADLWIVLAELHARTDDLAAALDAREHASRAVMQLRPPDPLRMLMVLAVEADATIRNGTTRAPVACFNLLRDCAQQAGIADRDRLIIAGTLMAVAQYHHVDCRQGRARVATLITHAPEEPMSRMLAATAAAMRDGCENEPPPELPSSAPFLPGAICQPRCDQPGLNDLAWRVCCQPGMHHHGFPPAQTSTPGGST